MISVGINGFGRIGKSVFIQLLKHSNIKVTAINSPNFNVKYIETYIRNDSTHKYHITEDITIIDNDTFSIGHRRIHIFRNRNAAELDWKAYGITHIVEATGAYLTTERAKMHNVDYVIMSAPPKDNTPVFVYNVNEHTYNGERIISNASCTTNCITPVLKLLNDKYKIQNANFTTIHSTTASQTTIDIVNSTNRTHRSILNNIIPHSTGASKAIASVIPSLQGKVFGTSLRVPTTNVSIVDLNIELDVNTTLEDIMREFESHPFIQVNSHDLVSSDFMTTIYPSIVDKNASMSIGDNRFKLMIWYDNEWSYSSQIIRLLDKIVEFNRPQPQPTEHSNKYFIDHFNLIDKDVVLRVDWNIPTKDFKITDDFRIASSLPTIRKIMNDGANRLIIMSHFGRPKGPYDKFSWKHYLDHIQTYFDQKIGFLNHGLTTQTLDQLKTQSHKIYLLENLRFHNEETNYKQYEEENECRQVIQQLGNFYVNDAFGCMHRDHLSICGIRYPQKAFGYLVNKELEALSLLTKNRNASKMLAICGGAKVHDKLPLLEALSKKMDAIYISGGNINGIVKNKMEEYITKISQNKAAIHLMDDGYSATTLTDDVKDILWTKRENLPDDHFFYDIGMASLYNLVKLIEEHNVIFWNGTLGVVENPLFSQGSASLVRILMELNQNDTKIIIGGGDTAAFVNTFNHKFYFVSTGGGACIDYISNGSLCGLDFFKD